MAAHPDYAYWTDALAGNFGSVSDGHPQAGFYRRRPAKIAVYALPPDGVQPFASRGKIPISLKLTKADTFAWRVQQCTRAIWIGSAIILGLIFWLTGDWSPLP